MSEVIEVKLIGGSADGKVMRIPPRNRQLKIPVGIHPGKGELEVETYERVLFVCDGTEVEVWVPRGWTGAQALRFLIERHAGGAK